MKNLGYLILVEVYTEYGDSAGFVFLKHATTLKKARKKAKKYQRTQTMAYRANADIFKIRRNKKPKWVETIELEN